jgi:hypothetical protein
MNLAIPLNCHFQALLFFTEDGIPQGLSARINRGSPILALDPSRCYPAKHSSKLLSEVHTICPFLPKLEIYHLLGEGSTGHVFFGRWKNEDVAVKISSDNDSRRRLLVAAVHYTSLQAQSRVANQQLQRALPTFMGWYCCHSFDLLILSAEGRPCGHDSWLALTREQRYVSGSDFHHF